MPSPQIDANPLQNHTVQRETRQLFRHVMACLDRSPDAAHVLEEAASIADQSGAILTVIRVIPGDRGASPCTDPVDWELTRREEIAELQAMAEALHVGNDMQAIIACGSAADCIQEEARKCDADLLVLGSGMSATPSHWGLGGTVRHIAETWPGSVLIVPPETLDERPKRARIIVPVDGSPQSQAALRLASAIAGKRTSELVILHAVPELALPDEDRLENDEGLLEKLRERKQRAADDRLRRLRKLLPADAHRNRVRRLSGEEPRQALMRAICEERGELVVLSARGLGRDPELPIGSTAEYLISRAVTPILLVRKDGGSARHVSDLAPSRPASVRGSSNARP